MKEQWRDVVGYSGHYEVSNLGQVRSVDRVITSKKRGSQTLRGRVLRSNPANRYGHLVVRLSKEGICRTMYVHRLVGLAWLGPCQKGQEVRHGPNGVTDNSVSNLCYGTRSENALDTRRDGTHGGKAVRRSDGVEFINISVAAEESGCWNTTICRVCKGKRQTTGGFGWEYI